jgi:hypothetical protein
MQFRDEGSAKFIEIFIEQPRILPSLDVLNSTFVCSFSKTSKNFIFELFQKIL